jgi:predicted NBD/HSP70 family sugar kinase
VERVEEITLGIHKGKIDDDELIGLAPLLLLAANEGDPTARAVVNRLADEISVMAITAMRRLDLTGQATPVILGGGIITARNPLLMDGITRQLAEAAPQARVRVIDVPPVVGAALLGLDHVQAPPAAESSLRAAFALRVLLRFDPFGTARRDAGEHDRDQSGQPAGAGARDDRWRGAAAGG